MRIKKVSQGVSQDYSVNGTYNTSQSQAYSCKYINDTLGKEVIYSGALQGTQTTTLSNVKRFLKIYATGNQQTTGINSIIYEIDTSLQDVTYGSGVVIAWDEVGGLDYYISESKFDKTNNTFTHTRTGFLKVSSNPAFTPRNTNARYIIYRIDTYD